MTQFSELGLAEPLTRALAELGHDTPTPIQSGAIPHVLKGRDLLGIAQTGTGKTAAFALPILDGFARGQRKRSPKACRALVLAPTRELAGQIADSFRAYGRGVKCSVVVAVGGVPIRRQMRALEPGVEVLVATPGRLLDLVDQRALTLGAVETLVLDEADQMLDLGFIHALRRVASLVPDERRTLFFSATMPAAIRELSGRFLTDPVEVSVAPAATTAEKVAQRAIHVVQGDKQALLADTLRAPEIDRALVFTRTKHGADRVVKHLGRDGIEAAAIHGNKSQGQRERALDAFRKGSCRVLVATDIAARGIDVPGVSHVVNFEIPNVPEQYVHRIGRTARAGADGLAVSFVAPDERVFIRDIEKLTRQSIEVAPTPPGLSPGAEPARAAPPPKRGGGRRPAGGGGAGAPGAGRRRGGGRGRAHASG